MRLTLDLAGVRVVLCDADGTLFPSEEPAFDASAEVTRRLAEAYGLHGDFSADRLRRATTGSNFRTTASSLLAGAGVVVADPEFDGWVAEERDVVTEHLGKVLTVTPGVVDAVAALASKFALAAVSSSALARLDVCFRATGLAEWIAPDRRFSAEDSMAQPVSKPDPAIYLHALNVLGCAASAAVAIEDSVTGARSAVAARIATFGLVQFVPPDERMDRRRDLMGEGVVAVADSWQELREWLVGG